MADDKPRKPPGKRDSDADGADLRNAVSQYRAFMKNQYDPGGADTNDDHDKDASIPVAPHGGAAIAIAQPGGIQIKQFDGKIAQFVRYVIVADGKCFPGTTDANGLIQFVSGLKFKGDVTLHVGDVAYALTFDPEPGDPVKVAQSQLNALGFSSGPIDGKKETRTTNATAYYQLLAGLPVTGELDAATLAKLKVDCDASAKLPGDYDPWKD
jgi:hypothetical protein